ncbi:molybdopterin biosynthesis protein [Corynebacterium maris DSM 45190]|uniref:Molybdopterin molybdenumtransferase n=1 Tax=Corynebacterium maris DSM 45190 TaxID=1224163 RepID=S5SZN1_9CORY|nr:molybdopterin molybdotransferase MoeA [Corynebacterium maris]AGS33730.1 molybdopterin biosynthesis protein [Corynebacterium maris DSM 45190]
MRSPEYHLKQIRAMFPEPDVITVPLAEAAGLIAAEGIVAAHDSPRFDNSQMDGYALSVNQVAATPGTFRVGPTIPAGTDPDEVYPQGVTDAMAPVMTGAKLPRGTAGVVAVESCSPGDFPQEGDFIEVPDVAPGQFMREAGADLRSGETLLTAGTRLNAAAIATIAGQSIAEVKVFRPASIVVCTGGAEIDAPGAAAIPDSNTPMMRAQAEQYGIEVAAVVRTDDDPQALERDLARAVEEHAPTAIVTSGGISHGKFEVVRQVLERHGWFGHVTQQPGGPQGVSRIKNTPVICLPGNPVSTLVSFRLFVAPALGHAPKPVTARITTNRIGLGGRDQFLRGRVVVDTEGVQWAEILGGEGSHLIAQSIAATHLIRVPADAVLRPGDAVTVYPL